MTQSLRSALTRSTSVLLAAGLVLGATSLADARTLNWARSQDSLTLDPHAQNEGPTHTVAHQIYEPLLHRDMAGQIVPALATQWAPTDDPSIWEFKLREGVTFHNGNAFNADDVVFSINRAKSPTSAMKELLVSVVEVRKIDDYTVHFVTDGPNPILPSNLTNLFMMDEDWTVENNAETPQDFANQDSNFAVLNTNGTGAFVLVSREPDSRTVMRRNDDYWGIDQFPMEVTEIVYTPIQSPATRVAAVVSGEIDLMQDVPVQDLAQLSETPGVRVNTGPQNRVIFYGLNVGDDDLQWDTVEGANPLADKRVRQAMNMAINRSALQRVVMRGQSQPTGVIMPPFVNGWTDALDQVSPPDLDAAKALLAEAGYPDGFGITLHCPNDRYINDEAICQATVGMLGRIGIDVTLDARPKSIHFAELPKDEIDFYMLGWGVPTFDSEYIFNFLVHSKTGDYGSWNATRYSNPELDEMIQSLARETDLDVRNQTIADIWATVQDEVLYIPLHNQVLNWAMSSDIDFPVQPEDQPHFKYLSFEN